MNKPIPPCNGCPDRNVEYCIICPKWEKYTEERKAYYDYTYRESSVKNAWLERFPQNIKKAMRLKQK